MWYQHEELGYNYRMSNLIAGVVRGQLTHLDEHIRLKRRIYETYKEGFKELPVRMNPYLEGVETPNFWLSCLLIEPDAMCRQVRGEKEALYISEPGKSCPAEILEALSSFGAEGRPIWKPMHMQPIYRRNRFVTRRENERGNCNIYDGKVGKDGETPDIAVDIFSRGLCLPSDIKMAEQEQDIIIEIIHRCFL